MIGTLVSELCDMSPMRALVVAHDTSLADVLAQLAQDHDLRSVCIVDVDERLVGVVNPHDLLQLIKVRLQIPRDRREVPVRRVRRLVMAKTIDDLMLVGSAETAVSLQDTLADTLNKMSQYDLVSIPVVDSEGRVVNDLRLSEVLSFAMAAVV
ncbi:MAG: CBS domain-containing protein [Chloroflexi bacterium]|nr:MAG: CBS domain-containing protein [Chloroflexota bacterium]